MEETPTTEKLSPRELLERYRYTGKLTTGLREAVCEAVRNGAPARVALRAFGLDDQTVRNWEKWAETGEKGTKYTEFARELGVAWNQWCAHVANLGPKQIERDARVWQGVAGALMPEYAKHDELAINVQIEAGPILAQIAAAKQKLMEGEYKLLEDTSESSV